jgi:hypothetical protein
VWDISPGYLNRQSLLGEHRELHGLYNILVEDMKGYSRHPETLRWVGAETGLVWRHAQLAAEMRLRGYTDHTPLSLPKHAQWPDAFVDAPIAQFELLGKKYADKKPGRIPLPRTAQALWAQHKYSIMARDPKRYRQLGPRVARMRGVEPMAELALKLTLALRERPPQGRLINALEHLWGHVKNHADGEEKRRAEQSPAAMLLVIQSLVKANDEMFLLASTALSELAVYVDGASPPIAG